MAFYNTSLNILTQEIARSLHDCVTAVVTSNGSTSNCISTALTETDDHYNGWDWHCYAGQHIDETREVKDFNASADKLMMHVAVTGNINTSDYFQLHLKHKWIDYRDAINRSIDVAKDIYLIDMRNYNTSLRTNTQEYDVPTGFRYIAHMTRENTVAGNAFPSYNIIDGRAWGIVHGTTPKIKFDNQAYAIGSGMNAMDIRIVGQTTQSRLTNGSNSCAIPPEFIVQQSRAILLQQEGKLDEAKFAQDRADIERVKMRTRPIGKSVFEA